MNDFQKFVKEKYDLDIFQAEMCFSTQNYVFVWENNPFVIRINISGTRSREEMLSELLWVDDLKAFGDTICEPIPSPDGNLIEKLELDGQIYQVSRFRKASGNTGKNAKLEPIHFLMVGELLGRVHAGSLDFGKTGLTLKRATMMEEKLNTLEKVKAVMNPQDWEKAKEILHSLDEREKNPESYGMIHGDFHPGNYYVDRNNIWLFDFDNCCYGFYIYDIGTVMVHWLFQVEPRKSRREVLEEILLPNFRIGYEMHMHLPEKDWKDIELFMKFRMASMSSGMLNVKECGVVNNLKEMSGEFCKVLYYPDITEGMDQLIKYTIEQHMKNLKKEQK